MVPTPMPNDPLESERAIARQVEAVHDLPALVRNDVRLSESIEAAAALVGGTRRVRLVGSTEASDVAEIGSWCFRAIGLAAVHDHPHDLIHQPSGFDPGDVIILVTTAAPTDIEFQVMRRAEATGINTISVVPADSDDGLDSNVRAAYRAPRPVALISAALILARIAATLEANSEHANSVAALEGRLNDLEGSAVTHADDVFAHYSPESQRILVCGSGPLMGVASAMARLLRNTRGFWAFSAHTEDVQLSRLSGLRSGDLLVELTGRGEMSELHEQIAAVARETDVERLQLGTSIANPERHLRLDADLSPAGAILTLAGCLYAVLGALAPEAVG